MKGIPEDEIKFIHEADTEVKKKELFAKVRKGEKAGVIDCEGHVIMPLGDYIDGKLHDDVGMLKSNEGTVFFLKDGKILSNYGKYEEAEKKFGALRVLKVTANEGLFVSEKNTQKGIVKLW